jgi:hypothetical protein
LAQGLAESGDGLAKGNGQGMKYASLDSFLAEAGSVLAKGPLALVFAEDLVEVDTSLRHHLTQAFRMWP